MAVQWNLAQMDPWQSFEAGFRIRRNIEAVRQQMQDRENFKALQKLIAEDERAAAESPARLAAAEHQKTWMEIAAQQRDDPESVDPRAYKTALTMYLDSGAQILREDAQRYESYGDQFGQNPLAVNFIREKLSRNAAQLEDYGRRIEAAENSLGALQERDMIGDQAGEEREDLSREKMLDRHSAERIAQINASGRADQPDPGAASRDAADFVRDMYSEDELKELGEPLNLTPSQLRRQMVDWTAKRFLSGEDPALGQFLELRLEDIGDQPAPVEKDDDATYARRAGRALRRVDRKTVEKGAHAAIGAGVPPYGAYRTLKEAYEGWKEAGAPLEDAVEAVGAKPIRKGGQ